MVKNKINVKQIIDNGNWEIVERKKRSGITGIEDVTVYFVKDFNEKLNKTTERLRLVIGAHVADKLGWEKGDQICVYYNPDNIMQFKLVKTKNGSGYSMSHYNPNVFAVTIPWPHKVALNKDVYPQIDYYFYNDDVLLCMLEDK